MTMNKQSNFFEITALGQGKLMANPPDHELGGAKQMIYTNMVKSTRCWLVWF
jgi:hypothetical protein